MNEKQRRSVDLNQLRLLEALDGKANSVLEAVSASCAFSTSERTVISSLLTDREKLIMTLQTLKLKGNGFRELTAYLQDKWGSLASEMRQMGGSGTSLFDRFCAELAVYYLNHCTHIPTFAGLTADVKDVRPLMEQIMTAQQKSKVSLSHMDLLTELKTQTYRSVAVIEGDPGMGKSSLVKKIACEWATCYAAGKADEFPFALVLKVQLKAAGAANSFIGLAVAFLLELLDCQEFDQQSLLTTISQQRAEVLICFDGLDEYNYFNESPFYGLFAEPFVSGRPSDARRKGAPHIPFKMIITSRPYACRNINMEFNPLVFRMCHLQPEHLKEFAEVYCGDKAGAVVGYIRSRKDIASVPLVLQFLCHWAKTKEVMPTNLTYLYVCLTKAMVLRESNASKLSEAIDGDNWFSSKVVCLTARLAYWGLCTQKTKFSNSDLLRFLVPNDSFVCGFLLHRYNIGEHTHESDFPHETIMDFFAALHCYHIMIKKEAADVDEIVLGICEPSRLFGRFLFGLSSINERFNELSEWLGQGIESCTAPLYTSLDRVLLPAYSSLADCTNEQCKFVAVSWRKMLRNLKKVIEGNRRNTICWTIGKPISLKQLSGPFVEGLQFGVDETPVTPPVSAYVWHIMSDQHLVEQLRVIAGPPPKNVARTTKTDVLVWLFPTASLEQIFSYVPHLPDATVLVIRAAEMCDCEVNFAIEYPPDMTRPIEHISFAFAVSNLDSIVLYCKKQKPLSGNIRCRVTEAHDVNVSGLIRWISVKAPIILTQERLLKELLVVAFGNGFVNDDLVLRTTNKQPCLLM